MPAPASAQFGKRLLQVGACGAGAYAGVKLGEKLADLEAKKLNLTGAEADKHRRAFQIGTALALCGGGAVIAGTTYSRLSKRGRENREKEVMAALEDAAPMAHTYADPENPSLMGTAISQPPAIEGNKECRVVQDTLGADQALVKYCRAPGKDWAVET